MKKTMEYWFDFGSNYSYISTMRIEALAAEKGVTLRWRPFLLGPIFQSQGWASSPFVVQQAKGNYVWHDMVRECRKAEIPWRRPTDFPRSSILAHRVALAGAEQPWIGAFCRRVMMRNFVCDQEIASESAMLRTLEELGVDAPGWIARAQNDDTKLALRDQTESARDRGIFGAPTFLVGGEMFWGNDRLQDAIMHACTAPSIVHAST